MSVDSEQTEPQQPTAFFTLSLLIDSVQINALIRESWRDAPRNPWNQTLLKKLRQPSRHMPHRNGSAGYLDTRRLQDAINPMFEDIADRSRNLFVEDFLLDTPNEEGKGGEWKNVCATVDLELPGAVRWETEGRPPVRVEPGANQATRFQGVLCRAFWMAHSNHALSYHLSFEVPFEHRLCDYFGLSMLQKAFFGSEKTDWLHDDATQGWQVRTRLGDARPLLRFVEGMFEGHAHNLISAVGAHLDLPRDLPVRFAQAAWQRLVLCETPSDDDESDDGHHHDHKNPAAQPTPSGLWHQAARRRRLLVLLRDKDFFDTLNLSRDEPGRWQIGPFKPVHEQAERVYRIDDIEGQIGKQVKRLNATRKEGAAPYTVQSCRIALFLSGFFQNIVDFLHQDDLEVHDGLAPIYPPPGAALANAGSNDGFKLYATQSAVYEVVRKSRSLDDAGRQWLGTCPYLFLVHMTAFHNESLVSEYEDNVSRLIRHLERKGLRSDADAAGPKFESVLDHAFHCIKDFRLVTFERVHKHFSFNIFRYETERTYFETIKDVRGMGPRREYWEGVLGHLTDTIDGMKQERSAGNERRLAAYGLALAGTGLLQVWLTAFPLYSDREPEWLYLYINGVVGIALLLAWIWNRRKLIPKRSKYFGKAWRIATNR